METESRDWVTLPSVVEMVSSFIAETKSILAVVCEICLSVIGEGLAMTASRQFNRSV